MGQPNPVGVLDKAVAILRAVADEPATLAELVGRTGLSRLNALLIISGAFGLFRRELVEQIGGWWKDTVGEDIELVEGFGGAVHASILASPPRAHRARPGSTPVRDWGS